MATGYPGGADFVRGMDDPRLLDALEANTTAAYANYAVDSGGEERAVSDHVTYIAGIPFALFNGVAQAQFAADDVDAQIAAALQPFRERGYPLLWWVGPSTTPASLGERLLSHGLLDEDAMPGMAIELGELDEPRQTHTAPASLVIEPVDSRESVEDFTQALRAGYGVPDELHAPLVELGLRQIAHADSPWRYFVGRLDGAPVATSQLFLHAGVAGVYAVATVPAARRSGIGEALTSAALREASARGYSIGILQASEMGQRIYERLGFRTLTSFHLYLWPGEQAQSV